MKLVMNLTLVLAAVFGFQSVHAGELTYQKFVDLLKKEQPSTVAEALALIEKEHPSFLKNYTLVARSMSLQSSSIEAPRVILFNDDGKFVLTFNGRADHRGYGRFEIMYFLEVEKKYEFREVRFTSDVETSSQTGRQDPTEEESSSQEKFQISEANGSQQRCLNCHGKSSLPIWDSYPFLPDAFGSQAKTSDNLLARLQKSEVEAYANFVTSKDTHERYRVLPTLSFEQITQLNSKFSDAIAQVISEVARAQLDQAPQVKSKVKEVVQKFSTEPRHLFLNQAEGEMLKKLSEYHQTKLNRYGRLYGFDKAQVLNSLLSELPSGALDQLSKNTGIARDQSLLLWTYTQTNVIDLSLVPRLTEQLGEDIRYFNVWSVIPGRRYIEFNGPGLAPDESGIVKVLGDLL